MLKLTDPFSGTAPATLNLLCYAGMQRVCHKKSAGGSNE
jgi:hypothetical protein